MNNFKLYYSHALAIIAFVLVSLIYFYPVLQGKKILQSDIVQYTAMAKEQNDFRAENNAEPYWTNSAFGGMPTYQLGAKYPHNYTKEIDNLLRFLPRPADYLFLYFLGFYILLLVLKINPLKATIGALAFGFSTYLIIILGVGHNAKAHAIAYMPMVIAGVLLVYKNKYILGGLLTMFAGALELNANHFQMTYYLLLLLIVITVYYLIQAFTTKNYKNILYSFSTFLVAGLFAIGANATNLLATIEYAKESTRSTSELTLNPDGSKKTDKNAISYEYITEYSYGILESFNLMAPRIFGGSNNEDVGTDSEMYEYVIGQGVPENQAKELVKGLPTYWGDQPIVAAPAYIGTIVFFFAIVALFCDKRKIKYVFLSGAIFSLLLSWGKNFPLLTNFFIDYIPFYNKYRAVSSIQVVLEICIPVLAILGLDAFFKLEEEKRWSYLWKAAAVHIGIFLSLYLLKGSFSFAGGSDSYYLDTYGPEFMDALKEDRKAMFASDILRSCFLVLLVFVALWQFIKKSISATVAILIIGFLMVTDLILIDKNYVNQSNFASKMEVDNPIEETPLDSAILQDKSHYRVFEISASVMSNPRTSYFHKSIGGYSAVKPRRMQELFDYHISKNNLEVLNMLHVKYFIQTNEKGEKDIIKNTRTNGNAWFVEEIKQVKSADEEMANLQSFNSKKVALVNDLKVNNAMFTKDSTSVIQLKNYAPNVLKYESNNKHNGFAVFSEAYYKKGWNAYLDGKLVPHLKVDYLLRGMFVPAGKHEIVFKFEPQVVKTGSTIAFISFIGMVLLLLVGIYFINKKKAS